MGAYEDFRPIRDRSNEIYGQTIKEVGGFFAKGITLYNQKQEALKKETDKINNYNQNLWFDIDRNENKLLQKNLTDYSGKKGELFDKYKGEITGLLNGSGKEGEAGYVMGAKRAQYLLKTEKNLDKNLQAKYAAVVRRYDNFMGNSLRTAGSIVGEAKEWDNIDGGGDGQKFVFKGQGVDQLRNRMTYFALSGKAAPDGITYDTDVYAGKDGESMVRAEIKYDKDSQAFKDLPEAYQKEIEANGMKLVFDQNWGEWAEDGLMSEINQGLDIEKTQANINFKDEKNKSISPTYLTSGDNYSESSDGTTTNYTDEVINMPKLRQETLPLAEAKAKTLIAGDIGELEDYIGYTLRQGGQEFSLSDTEKKYDVDGDGKVDMTIDQMRKDPKVFQKWVTRLTQDSFIEESLEGSYEKRIATSDDVKLINNLNTENEVLDVTGLLTEKDQVYVRKVKGSSYRTPDEDGLKLTSSDIKYKENNDRYYPVFKDKESFESVESPDAGRRIYWNSNTKMWVAQVKAGVGGNYANDLNIKPNKDKSQFQNFLKLTKPKISK
tara:strand:+ start:1067 stop:2716 length:1650 start_codon:yes stop_codon:yes gene_type:complete